MLQINTPFHELRRKSYDICNEITELAQLLQKNNKKQSKMDYRIKFYNSNYTNSEISYMVVRAVDYFDHKHQSKDDPLSHIKLKIEGIFIVIINEDYVEKRIYFRDGVNIKGYHYDISIEDSGIQDELIVRITKSSSDTDDEIGLLHFNK